MTTAADRPTAYWLATLKRRAAARSNDYLDLKSKVTFANDDERRAAMKFFNAAFRAEESGLAQAHTLADSFADTDPEFSETLRLYGDEEGWHRALLTEFLEHLGGSIQPMGRTTRLLYRIYGRAKRMDSILLTNLMFETIGSTTYRITLGRVSEPTVRQMLTILTRDEAFHVPLNVHFLKRAISGASRRDVLRLRIVFELLFVVLVALPLASRPKSGAFDRIGTLELMRAYARELARVFARESGLPLSPPWLLLRLLGVDVRSIRTSAEPAVTSVEAAERAARREDVDVTVLEN